MSASTDDLHPFGPGSHAPLADEAEMPACHPIKGNADSMKYHRPDSRSYGATIAEVWFVSPSVAEAAGFVLAGSHPKDSSSADFEPGGSGHPCSVAEVQTTVYGGSDAHPYGPGSHAPLADEAEMPACHPIKGNADSMKYHRPDSRSYGATIAEVWFVSPSVAEAAGFALAGSHPKDSSSADFEPGASGHPCTVAEADGVMAAARGVGAGGSGAAAAATGVATAAGVAALADIGDDDTIELVQPASAGDAARETLDASGVTVGGETGPSARDTVRIDNPSAADAPSAADEALTANVVESEIGEAVTDAVERPAVASVGTETVVMSAADVAAAAEADSGDSDIAAAADGADSGAGDVTGVMAAAGAVGLAGAAAVAGGGDDDDTDAASSADQTTADAGDDAVALAGGGSGAGAFGGSGGAGRGGDDGGGDGGDSFDAGSADDGDGDDDGDASEGDDETTATDDAADAAAAFAAMSDDDRYPFGPGSHAPFPDDVHRMPECHPIKGNADSMKYHRPDSHSYAVTRAEVWFLSPSAAEAAGFELAGAHPKGSSSADYEPGADGHPCTAAEVDGLGLGGLLLGAGSAVGFAAGAASLASGDGADDVGAAGDDTVVMPAAGALEDATDVNETVEIPAAHATADGPGDDVEGIAGADVTETVQMPAAVAADAVSSEPADDEPADDEPADDEPVDPDAVVGERFPFGPGSHAPYLADVHRMPECHPIKGNADSMKYHRPDSQGYEVTKAEVWFLSPSVAEAAGFALAGSHPEGSSSADFEPGGPGHPCAAEQVDGMGFGGLLLAGGAAAAGVAGLAALDADDDTDAEPEVPADDAVAEPAATDTVVMAAADVDDLAAADDTIIVADGDLDDDDDATTMGTGMAAAGAAGVGLAAAGAAALLGDDGPDLPDGELPDVDLPAAADLPAAEVPDVDLPDVDLPAAELPDVDLPEVELPAAELPEIEIDSGEADETDDDDGIGAGAMAAGAAAVGAAAAGAAALLGRDDDDAEPAPATEVIDTDELGTGDEGERSRRGAVAAGVGAAGAAGAAAVGGARAARGADGGSGGIGDGRVRDDDDDGGGAWGWLKWLLPLLLLALLLGLLLWACGGDGDDGEIAAVADPTATAAPEATEVPPTATEVPPTATAVPPTATAVPPTPTPEPEPAPDPTATPVPPTPTPEPTPAPSCPSIGATLAGNGFTTVGVAVEQAGLSEALSTSGPLTLFAPTDEAFGAIPAGVISNLLGDTDLLTQVLQYHVVPGAVGSADLAPGAVATLNGSALAVRTDLGAPTVNAAGVATPDIAADACVIHGIDSVLVPPALLTTLGVDSLNSAVGGEPIQFVDGSADFTTADQATLDAMCALVSAEADASVLPAVKWQASGDETLDATRAAAIAAALAGCGPDGLSLDRLAPRPSFTG